MKGAVHRVDGVNRAHTGRDGVCIFVAVVAVLAEFFLGNADVAVRVDKTGIDLKAVRANHFRIARRRIDPLCDIKDFAVLYQDIALFGASPVMV